MSKTVKQSKVQPDKNKNKDIGWPVRNDRALVVLATMQMNSYNYTKILSIDCGISHMTICQ